MTKVREIWARISLQKKLFFIFGLMAFLILGELLTLKYSMSNLTAVRAFVYGESVWSKAQKDSAYYLKRMAITKSETDYQSYQDSLFVAHECRLARLELLKENPDMELVRRGFINGKIHPDEVGPILHMIQKFYWLENIETALRTWKEADELLQEFEKQAVLYHDAVMDPKTDENELKRLAGIIDDLNFKLGEAENTFSDALQKGARWLENVVFISLLLLVIIVETTGLLLVFFFGRSLANALTNLIERATKIGRGEFGPDLPVKTHDEVGRLTVSINHMGRTIQSSQSELERKINEAVKTRDEFFSIATHELKTPVTAIQLSLQMLEKKLLTSDDKVEKDKILSQVEKCILLAQKLTSLQDTLMDVTRISGGLFSVNMHKHDLMASVREAVEESKISESDPPISVTGPEKLESSFDQVRIEQVISNLVKNALKYGGDSPIKVEVKPVGSETHILVIDQGKGIPQHLHEKIFDQYIRVNDDAGISGLGMGLYISRKIMEAHGGSLRILSSSEKGTTFQATLPSARISS